MIPGKITVSTMLCFLVSVFCGHSGPLNTRILIYTYNFFFPSARYYSLKYQEEKSPFLLITDKWLQLNLRPFSPRFILTFFDLLEFNAYLVLPKSGISFFSKM